MWKILRYVIGCDRRIHFRYIWTSTGASFSFLTLSSSIAQVDSLSGKEAIVNNGLKSVRRDIDEFLSYFPNETVEEMKAKIMNENELNYKEFDPSLGSILNPNPK